jgi:hypothetical protein
VFAAKPEAKVAPGAAIEMARLARYDRDWDAAQCADAGPATHRTTNSRLQRSHCTRARPPRARPWRVRDARRSWRRDRARPQSRWLWEIRFYSGVACFFAGERDRSKFHWVWVCENIPDDRLYQRCYFSATIDQNPYPNPELGRNDMDFVLNPSGSYSPANTLAAFAAAKEVYEQLATSSH